MLCRQNLETPTIKNMLNIYHASKFSSNQCGSSLVQTIDAPLPLVWSLIRRFEYPQGYKLFVKKCTLLDGDGGIGSVREVMVTSGLPAGVSVERLDKLDDDKHVLKFSIIGGDHRLVNYSSTITLHEEEGEYGGKTVAIESYSVDVPAGSSGDDTCSFANTIIACNLRSLAKITEEKNQYGIGICIRDNLGEFLEANSIINSGIPPVHESKISISFGGNFLGSTSEYAKFIFKLDGLAGGASNMSEIWLYSPDMLLLGALPNVTSLLKGRLIKLLTILLKHLDYMLTIMFF